ncbi:DUF4145 domain-containing protein [Ottowia sp. GY511]|uniref:DUF4145 domain-containing protein n=1 Tax=Ottowia flava TaxID=2675430 RepID=A0ABW4KRV0_9BURK|nr:DUF4145 domain-containing protein [Ottowia sp. GY511]
MDSKPAKTFLECDRCRTATVHTLLHTVESDVEFCDADGYKGHEPATYRLLQCDGCSRVSVYVWSALHSPHSQFGEREYPGKVPELSEAPALVRKAFHQAERVRSVSNEAYAVKARAVLETIVRDRGVEQRNLAQGLAILADQEAIPPLLAKAATYIRLLGNAAAHSVEVSFTENHVRMIETFVAALINHLYIWPTAFQEFSDLLGGDGDGDGDGRCES